MRDVRAEEVIPVASDVVFIGEDRVVVVSDDGEFEITGTPSCFVVDSVALGDAIDIPPEGNKSDDNGETLSGCDNTATFPDPDPAPAFDASTEVLLDT